MIVVISGSNRPGARTLVVARAVERILTDNDVPVELLDLHDLPGELFAPSAYSVKPPSFGPFQQAILDAHGILSVVPEYNGSFPGALKYFIDMLRFPESLYEKPAAFVGLANGRWGGLRAVEQLEMVFQYRHAHLFGRRVFLPAIGERVDDTGRLTDVEALERLQAQALDFAAFCRRLRDVRDSTH
jgi:NAD(P)H-dependent FMN reductase